MMRVAIAGAGNVGEQPQGQPGGKQATRQVRDLAGRSERALRGCVDRGAQALDDPERQWKCRRISRRIAAGMRFSENEVVLEPGGRNFKIQFSV